MSDGGAAAAAAAMLMSGSLSAALLEPHRLCVQLCV